MSPERSLIAQLKRVRSRGLTLVETLVVLAIAVLLIGVLLFYIFPSDDRLCRLEAERLAAYMTGAAAEAVMRDGGARVALNLRDSTGTRQVTRQGADITRELWEEDKKAELHRVKSPVLIQAVDTPGLPNLGSGTGYVIFMGRKTEGAVVVLALEKSLYSVIIPPAGGEIRVEQGRGNIPGAQQFERPKIPDLTGYNDNIKKSKGGLPSGGVPPSAPLTRRYPPRTGSGSRSTKSAKDLKKIEPPDDRYSPSPSEYEKKMSPYPTPSGLGSISPSKGVANNNFGTDDPVQPVTPKNNDGPCQTYADCLEKGPWRVCQAGQCRVWPYQRTLMLSSIVVREPDQLSSVLEGVLTELISQGQLNLMLNLDQPSPWLIQGTRTGSADGLPRYGQSESFPTYRGMTSLITGCDVGLCVSSFRPDNEDNSLTIYVRDVLVDEDSNQCKYQPLVLIDVTVVGSINVQPTPGIVGQQFPTASIMVRGSVRRSAARGFRVKENESLLDTLENFNVPENKDTIGDGFPDSWEFVFEGPARAVFFEDDPTSQEEASPEGCEL